MGRSPRRPWLRNRGTGERYDVRDDDFDQAVRMFEPPDDEPDIVTIEEINAKLQSE